MKKISWILLILIPMAWGTTLPMSKWLGETQGVPSAVVVFIRFTITAIIMFPIAYKKIAEQNLRTIINALVVGTFLAAGYIFQFAAVDYMSSATVAVIGSFNIIIVPLTTLFVFKIKVHKYVWFAVPFAIAGSIVMEFGGESTFSGIGFLFAVLATLAYAIQSSINGNAETGTSMRAFTFFMIVASAIVSGLYVLSLRMMNGPAEYTINATSWMAILFLAIGCTFFPFFARQLIFKHIHVSKAILVMSSELIFTVLFATLAFGEPMKSVQIIGIVLILLAIFVSQESWKAFKIKRIKKM